MSIEVVKHDQEPYAFTLKALADPKNVRVKDYAPVLEHMSQYGLIKCAEVEHGLRGVCHIHGIILLRRGFFRKKLCFEGFHMKLEFMYNEVGWKKYIRKERDPNASTFRDINLFEVGA